MTKGRIAADDDHGATEVKHLFTDHQELQVGARTSPFEVPVF